MARPKVSFSNHASTSRIDVTPEFRSDVLDRLKDRYSYLSDRRWFSPAFRAHAWDGRISLVEAPRGTSTILLPAGFREDASAALARVGYDVVLDPIVDSGPSLPRGACWTGPPPRDYQVAGAEAGLARMRGILQMPTRSGKTLMAALMILRLGRRALFIVTSDLLLNQATLAFRSFLGGVRVSRIGAGDWDDEGDIVVASIQTLVARGDRKAYERLRNKSFGVMFSDENHHVSGLTGEAWRDAATGIDAPRKYGLSATIDVKPLCQQDPPSLWLHAVTGPLLYQLPISDLIERQYLAPLTVTFYRHRAAMRPEKKWSSLMYKAAITECEERNRPFTDHVLEYAQTRPGVLVDCGRVEHAHRLHDLLAARAAPGTVGLLIGATTDKQRDRVLQGFRAGTIRTVVSTVLGEGVDIPECWAVANAEGGRGEVATLQRLRCLTPTPWKAMAHCIEMADHHHRVLQEWTLERIARYRDHAGFKVQYEKPLPSK